MKQLFKNFIVVVLILITISGIFAIANPQITKPVKEITLSELTQSVNQGQIQKISVNGNELSIQYTNGDKATSRKETDASLSQSLLGLGASTEQLQKLDVAVQKESGGLASWLIPLLSLVLPVIIFAWFFFMIFKQSKGGGNQTFNFLKAPAKMFGDAKNKQEKVTFKDIAGIEEAKDEIKEVVDFLKNPQKYQRIGARIPRGVLLIGPPGTGKCIVGDSLVLTNKGLMEIQEIPKYFSVDPKTNQVYGAKLPSINLKPLKDHRQTASHWYDLGEQKTIKITLQQGLNLEGTPEHPIVVLNEHGELTFKHLEQIRENDQVALKFNTQSFGSLQEVDTEKAYMMGLLTGDGNLSHSSRIGLTTTDSEIVNSFQSYIHNRYGEDQWIGKGSDGITQTVTSWKAKKDFYNAGMSYLLSYDKTIPTTILQAPKETIASFLQGLFDADGYFERYSFGFSTVSKKLSDQILVLLLNFGIVAYRRIKANLDSAHPRPVYEITISGIALKTFAKEIGFRLSRKQKQVNQYLNTHKIGNTNVDVFPYIVEKIEKQWKILSQQKLSNSYLATQIDKIRKRGRVSRNTLAIFLKFFKEKNLKNAEVNYLQTLYDANLFFTPVTQITTDKNRVYDFTVPKYHSFIANGLVNHNTLLARAVANEAGVPFFSIAGSEFVELFVGVGSARVRSLFETAKKNPSAIIFIDEIDSIGKIRGVGLGGGHDEREQTLNQILAEMDGFEKDTGVIVMAATNRPEYLDPALLRPGRFDRRIILDLPDVKGREEILKIHVRDIPLANNVNLTEIAERTPGFSGADLANLVNEAAIFAARKNKDSVGQTDFLESIEKVLLGPERKSHLLSVKEKEIAAYHEAGHALISALLPNAEEVRKVSIIARGMAAGYTLSLPKQERKMKTKTEFLADLSVLLGGYCAERSKFGEISTGASNDLEKASFLSRAMVTKYGMSVFGPMSFGKRESMPFLGWETESEKNYSDKTADQIDKETERFIKEAETKTLKMLQQKKPLLEKIAKVLIEKETIEKEEFDTLINGVKAKKERK